MKSSDSLESGSSIISVLRLRALSQQYYSVSNSLELGPWMLRRLPVPKVGPVQDVVGLVGLLGRF